jgi:DNA helicase II / ATP-dependent DNA helicase PcrA
MKLKPPVSKHPKSGSGHRYLQHICSSFSCLAVQHSPTIPLQILAGPGSGKTRVLTSRIVHLITVHGIPPSAICAVTFTNKAANEMRERLTKMLGKELVMSIKMGTFHSLCARYLRKYAALVGMAGNFTVCDADERCAYYGLFSYIVR